MLLRIENISKSYGESGKRNYRPVLADISLELEAGQSLAILGPSGSGKSTLLNIIGTLDQPDKGNIELNHKSLTELSENQLTETRNREIGFIFQSHHLLNQCNVLENVLLPTLPIRGGKKAYEEKALELIKRVGLWEQRFDFPTTLSGGECQRVAAIRALINQPKLLLADEPTGSLDEENANAIIQLLLELKDEYGTSLIVVTHAPGIASKMDRRVELTNKTLNAMK